MTKISKGYTLVVLLCFLSISVLMEFKKEPYMLGVFGYNYADRGISDFRSMTHGVEMWN